MIDTVGFPVRVPTPGTPVPIMSVMPYPDKHVSIHGIMFQVLPTNTGLVYVGRATMNKTTYAQVFAFLAIPTTNFLPTFSAALTIAPNALRLEEFYIDADVATNGVIVTFLVT